ncbi:MAG: hypothetical protein JNM44_03370 [Chitinophagaceae bacterium]|nr:hypothetical protein [Chitinophagaceae bacterium]
MPSPLFDDNETYLNQNGLVVFTAEYLLKRGYCCGNGCLHCPYDYKNVIDLKKKERLLEERKRLAQHEDND